MRGRRLRRRSWRKLLHGTSQRSATHIPDTKSFSFQPFRPAGQTHPHKTSRTPTKHPIPLHHLALPPRTRPSSSSSSSSTARVPARGTARRRAFDVIVESLDYVPRARFFQVGGFVAVDLVFERCLGGEMRRLVGFWGKRDGKSGELEGGGRREG